MGSKHEPAIWARDTGQRILCFDRCQLIIAWLYVSRLYVSVCLSLQCRRFWWGFGWFSSFECLAAILDSLQTGRIGARMRCENVGGGGGRPKKIRRCFDRTPTNSSVVEGTRVKCYQT